MTTSGVGCDPELLLVTPTYDRALRLRCLERCAESFRRAGPIRWIVVEDAANIDTDVKDLLDASGIAHDYFAHGPTRCWGNAQRNRALEHIRDNRLGGVVYLADDDNKYEPPLFDELRRVRNVGVLPVGRLGPWGVERPIVRAGRIARWSADWRSRRFPVDMAGFAFNARLLDRLDGDLFSYHGRGGETEFIERLIDSPDDLEPLCDDCRSCYVWHNMPLGWSNRQGLAAYWLHRRTPSFLRRPFYRARDNLLRRLQPGLR